MKILSGRADLFFRRAFACLCLFACIFCVSCGVRETPAQKAAKDGTLLVGNGADPATLDPALSTGLVEFKIMSGLFEGLVTADTKTLDVLPAAAKRWDISADKKIYTFYLDESAKWSDGTPVTARDFQFAWRRVVNPRLGAEYASLMFPIKNARAIYAGKEKNIEKFGAKAIEDFVFRVELEKPTPYFLSMLYHNVFFPVSQKCLEKFGGGDNRDSRWTRPQNMVCNGAFVLSKWSINDRVSLRKNNLYRDAKNVFLNGVDFFPISNINTEDRAFRAGQLHITESIAPSRMDSIKRDYPQCLRSADWLGVYYYLINTRKPPFDDPRVRLAFAMSLDRNAIIDSFLKGGQREALSFVPENCAGYKPKFKLQKNVEIARKLLKEAGYGESKKFPTVRLTYNTSEQHKPIAEAAQQMWRENLGVEVELVNLSWPAYLAARRDGDFEIARASWVGDFAAPESFLDIFQAASQLNHSGYDDKKFDELLKAAAEADSQTLRMEFLGKAEEQMLMAAPIIPIYFYTRVCLISAAVNGWDANLLDYHNYKNVKLDASALMGGAR